LSGRTVRVYEAAFPDEIVTVDGVAEIAKSRTDWLAAAEVLAEKNASPE
jgi:hypothetical protein